MFPLCSHSAMSGKAGSTTAPLRMGRGGLIHKEEPMFGFKRKPGRTGLRAALLVGAVAAAFGVGGANPGSAMALCGGANEIKGEGASFQNIAQGIWKEGFEGLCAG